MILRKQDTQTSVDTLRIAPNEHQTVFFSFEDGLPHTCAVSVAHHGDVHVIVLAKGSGSITYSSSLEHHAKIHWHIITIASADSHHVLTSECIGDDAVSTVDWIFIARRNEKIDLTVQNIFSGKRGGGEVTMKGIAEGKGNVRAHGMINIGPQGTGTNTYLTEDVLMLDPTAKVDAIPALEIKTNDVKASHSATVSRVTEEDLFYFAARGIDKEIARGMYVDGFLRELIEAIPEESMVRTIGNIIFSM